MTKFLFIGGPEDGKWIDVEDTMRVFFTTQVSKYFPEHIKSAGASLKIFRYSDLSGTQALSKLIRGYRN